MPVQVSFPGVYIQEVPSGVHTITGVSTSIAAFIGRASKGKMNKATRILSLADYVRTFGAPHKKSDLANSIKLFFANGGTDCYVIRIASGASPAAVTMRSLAGDDVLVATAKAEGEWGNTVRLEVDYKTANPDETFNLRVILEEQGVATATEAFNNLSLDPNSPRFAPSFVTQSSELIDLSATPGLVTDSADVEKSVAGSSLGFRGLGPDGAGVQATLAALIGGGKTQFDISVNGSGFANVNLSTWVVPATLATQRSELTTRINDALTAQLPSPAPQIGISLDLLPNVVLPAVASTQGRLLRITSSTGDRSSVRVRRAAANDLSTSFMLGVDQGGIEVGRWSNFRPAPNATFMSFGPIIPVAGQPALQSLDNLVIISELTQGAITGLTIDGVPVVAFNLQTTGAADIWTKNAVGASPDTGDHDGVREKLGILATAINLTPGLPWRAEVIGYHLSIIARSGTINQQPTIVFAGTAPAPANLLGTLTANVRQYTLGIAGAGGTFSTGGVDGSDGGFPTAVEYEGDSINQTGFHALDPVDLFNLMIIPADQEVTEAVHLNLWGPASNYCASRRAFLLIDAPPSWTTPVSPINPVPRPAVVNNTSRVDSDVRSKVVKINSAVFYPRLIFNDLGINKSIGPSGAIAGLMARIDSSRGVWKAPAGTEADLRNINGLEVNLTDLENGVLNKLGVNCERIFTSGIVNWGARTMDGSDDFGSEWKYIPIRRTALFLEESLFRGTKWVVFEPNDEPLYAKIRLNLNAFMMSLFRQGAFQGTTPDKAFFVKCDGETTTQNDRNLGIVNIEVGFAPLKPAEFVIIKIQQIAGDL
jgi:phage tail sheath protein FI